jgi:hypothetical protein
MKDTDADQLIMLTDHRENRADILDIAQMHGVIDTALNGMKQQFGTLTGGINQLRLLVTDVKGRIDEDTAHQQGDSSNDDAGSQAFEQEGLLACVSSHTRRQSDIFSGLFFIGAEEVKNGFIETHNVFRRFFGGCRFGGNCGCLFGR